MEIIRCEDLSKIYESGSSAVRAVDGVSLSFTQGSFTAVTGKSGSGKSTLLHLLSGLDRPSDGRVFYQDNELFSYSDNQLSVLRRRCFGFVFQAYNLVRELTARENILLPVMLDNRKPDEAYLKRMVDILGINDGLALRHVGIAELLHLADDGPRSVVTGTDAAGLYEGVHLSAQEAARGRVDFDFHQWSVAADAREADVVGGTEIA